MILITGGAGYIGSHTCVELINAGYEIVIVDNFSNSSPKAIERVEEITGKKVNFIKADLRNEAALEKVFTDYEFQAVIHFAGSKSVGESAADPLFYFDNNINASICLLKKMKQFKVEILIFSSSATVYSSKNQSPYNENMLTGEPSSNYGYTKLIIEQMLQKICTVEPNWSIALLRYFNPIGAHPSSLIGEHPRGIPNNLLPYITQVAIGLREQLNIFGGNYPTTDGTAIRDYLHVMDLANAHVLALKNRLKNKGCDIWNVGTGNGYSVLEIKDSFERVNNISIPFQIIGRREGDLPIVYADNNKITHDLGWSATYGLEEMLEHSWKWQVNNPNGYDE